MGVWGPIWRHSFFLFCFALTAFIYVGCQSTAAQEEPDRFYTYYGADEGRSPVAMSLVENNLDLSDEPAPLNEEELDFEDDAAGPHAFAHHPLMCKDSVYYASWENQIATQKDKELNKARVDTYIRLVYPGVEKIGFDFPLEMNSQVLNWVDYFTGTGRKQFATWLRRGQLYIPEMEKTLEKRGLPKDLVYLAMIESGYSTRAASHVGAVGIWQFMPATGREYNLIVNEYLDERRNPEKSVEAAAIYLSALYSMFGDWHLAAASYNCGPGCIQRTLKNHGTDSSYFELTSKGVVNKETADYVPKMIAAMLIGKNAAAFGFDPSQNAPIKTPTKSIAVTRSIALNDMAKALGINVAVLEALNPELRKGVTPAPRFSRNGSYSLKVPTDKHSQALAAVDSLKTAPEPTKRVARQTNSKSTQKAATAKSTTTKKIQGVTLASSAKASTKNQKASAKTPAVPKQAPKQESVKAFAARYGIKVSDIVKLNKGFSASTIIKKGQSVYIPK